jgi:hypothetical protein
VNETASRPSVPHLLGACAFNPAAFLLPLVWGALFGVPAGVWVSVWSLAVGLAAGAWESRALTHPLGVRILFEVALVAGPAWFAFVADSKAWAKHVHEWTPKQYRTMQFKWAVGAVMFWALIAWLAHIGMLS